MSDERKQKEMPTELAVDKQGRKSDSQIPDLEVNGSGSFITIRIPRSDFD